jgi:hypothetical protein
MNKLSNYEEVKDRLPRFWKAVDKGRITTEILNHSDDFSRVVIKASLWDGDSLLATGIAMDWKDKDRNANRTNWVEVAETSAIGRAIANSRFQDPKAARPSREEMEVAIERQDAIKPKDTRAEIKPFTRQEMLDAPSDGIGQKPAWLIRLETRFGTNEGKVTNFYLNKGIIRKGSTWRDVPEATMTKIKNNLEALCQSLGI